MCALRPMKLTSFPAFATIYLDESVPRVPHSGKPASGPVQVVQAPNWCYTGGKKSPSGRFRFYPAGIFFLILN